MNRYIVYFYIFRKIICLVAEGMVEYTPSTIIFFAKKNYFYKPFERKFCFVLLYFCLFVLSLYFCLFCFACLFVLACFVFYVFFSFFILFVCFACFVYFSLFCFLCFFFLFSFCLFSILLFVSNNITSSYFVN